MLLAAAGTLPPSVTAAMERKEKPVTLQPVRDADAEVVDAQEDVRRAEAKALAKRRAGGRELSEAQEEMVAARERLRVLRAEASDRRYRDEQRQYAEQARRDREAEEARRVEFARQQQEDARRRDDEDRMRKERREAERQQAQEEAREQLNRRSEESSRQAAAQEAKMVRQWREEQREQAKPQNVLTRLYASYIQVKRCHASLAGRAYVYVDDRELAAARDQTKFVEGKLAGANPELDRDAAWQSANERSPAELLFTAGADDVEAGVLSERGQGLCRGALAAVKEQYLGYNPDAAIVKKDF